jgi:hypothetical protein
MPAKGKTLGRLVGPALLTLWLCVPCLAQFLDEFNGPLKMDPAGVAGWGFLTGEGRALMDLVQEDGYISVVVDATGDRRGVWWALIKRRVSDRLDLALLRKPGHALRVEARIRTSHAPRRVNLHVNTQRTTDFHSHLMEYDIADTTGWHTISMTTRGFDAGPGDRVNAQMALMDWGLGRYRVDVDYFRVDVVETARSGPDEGEPLPYHPPVADPGSFGMAIPVAADSTVDTAEPDVNLNGWCVQDAGRRTAVVTAGGTRSAVLRWDVAAFAGKKAAGPGLLELTTRSLERDAADRPDFGLVRLVEITGGESGWDERTVTWTSFISGRPADDVLDPQMIIDWPVTGGDGGKTYLTIPRPVLQRLLDGRARGLAVRPLGAINASFYSRESGGTTLCARLLFSLGK